MRAESAVQETDGAGRLPGIREWPPSLPIPLTALLGREHDLAEVGRLIEEHRLVTLVGAGGVGKTRLAVEQAAAMAPCIADGVDLVDLSGTTDPVLVWPAVARVVGVEERADTSLARRVIQLLRPQNRLLVLDNCEHLRDECALIATELLGYCRELRILATSREGLAVPGEVTWRVPSLTFPPAEHPLSPDELDGYGALALFLDRARAVRPGLVIGPADVPALAAICSRLDGIPLALELAAARVSAFTLTEIAERLDDQFALLSRPPGGHPRHQTLRASVMWSYRLLTEPERALLRRLSVFADGWSLRAAETVCDGSPVSPGEAARLLATLVDKSLVHTEELVHAEETATGTRYRLLEVIRAFALERLAESGEMDRVRARHGAYFARLASAMPARLHGPDQDEWARRLDSEQANFRAARAWCAADARRAGLGLAIASGLWEYWLIRGRLDEATGWLDDALQRASAPVRAKAEAMTGLAVMASLRGKFCWGGELLVASISLHGKAGNRQGQSRALALLGFWRSNDADSEGAAEALDRALTLAQTARDRYFAAFALLMAAMAASLSGETVQARERADECLDLCESIGDLRAAGYAQCVLADCLISEGAPADALVTLRVCVRTFEGMLDRWGLLISTSSAARAYAALGDWRQAAFALGIAGSLSERIGGTLFPGMQQAVDAVAATIVTKLGAAAPAQLAAGRTAGRGDRIAAALDSLQPPAPPGTSAQQPFLTRREHEIAELIARGLTNRQIASRLSIAQRTVDTHVGHILAKLGCRNRSQVATLSCTGQIPALRS